MDSPAPSYEAQPALPLDYVGYEPGSIALSAEGKTVIVAGIGLAYVSPDAGATWAATGTSPASQTSLQSVACSADGGRMVAVAPGDTFYYSTNWGATLNALAAPSNNWSAVASSADGGRLVAVVNGGGIYTWQTTIAPRLRIRSSTQSTVISWIIPSSGFVLQRSSSLAPPQWTDVPVQPTLNLSNLENEVMLSPSRGPAFYRLRSSGQ